MLDSPNIPDNLRLFVVLAYDGVTLLDLAGPAEVFDIASKEVLSSSNNNYKLIITSEGGRSIRSSSGIDVSCEDWTKLNPSQIDTVLVPGGGPPQRPPIPTNVVACLKNFAPHARRICAICTGTFILATAGLADNRRVTTHWQSASEFAERFPKVILDVDPVFIQDGPIWSSAGFSAGIDMALALLEEDEGYDAAIKMARLMIMFLKRSSGQSQFSQQLTAQLSGGEDFNDLHVWIAENLQKKLTIDQLANQVNMAPRTFARHYTEKVGLTPAKSITKFRLEAACRLLAENSQPLKQIAQNCGFVNEQQLRRAFIKNLRVTPQEYRKNFGARV